MKERKSKNIVLTISIFILTLFVTIYGLNTLFERPSYDNYCQNIAPKSLNNQTACIAEGGKWTSYERPENNITGYCDTTFECRTTFDEANKRYSKKLFLIAMPLAILIIIIGAFLSITSVGTGLMLGGVGTILYGTGSYWGYASNPLKFIISLIGLAILIWLAFRLERKVVKKKKR